MGRRKLIYLAYDGSGVISTTLPDAVAEADEFMCQGKFGSVDRFIVEVTEYCDGATDDPNIGVEDVRRHMDALTFHSSVYAGWDADVIYVRNDCGDVFPVMSYSGHTIMLSPCTVTEWQRGELVRTMDVVDQPPLDDDTSVEHVNTEVARFGRIWTDECRMVNGGNIAPILHLFLTTVAEDYRTKVHTAVLKEYGKS